MLTPFQNRVKEALSDSGFFGALPAAEFRWLLRVSVRKGETLFEKGEPSDALYGLVEGTAKQLVADFSGQQVSLGLVAPGEMLGDAGILAGVPRPSSAVALSDCEFAVLKRRDLGPLLERCPSLQTVLAEVSTEAMRRLSERIEDSAFLSVEARVEKALTDLAHRFGKRIDERGVAISLRQQDLADVLGLSRASVNRVLTSSAMRGRVELSRGAIVVLSA